MGGWRLRTATPEDVALLVGMRRWMFEAIGHSDAEALKVVESSFRDFAEERLSSGEYRGWIAEDESTRAPIGTIGLLVETRPATPRNRDGRIGYLMNVYVDPAWRRKGLGTALVEAALETLRAEGVGVAALHASPEGRELYARLGFEPSSEMRLFMPLL